MSDVASAAHTRSTIGATPASSLLVSVSASCCRAPSSRVGPAEASAVLRSTAGVAQVDPPVPLKDGGSTVSATLGSAPTSSQSRAVLSGLRQKLPGAAYLGETERFDSLLQSLRSRLPYVVLALLLASGFFLGLLTRSLVIPLKNAVMSVLTLTATLGILVVAFQWGPFGGLSSLEVSSLIIVGVLAYGLSTDYAAFLFHRMTEERQAGRPANEAIAEGLARTGPLVTAAAAVLFLPLFALTTTRLAPVQMLGFGSAVSVLLDATFVRILLIPSLMVLLGRYNWWPSRIARR